jgi:hypothetical protein
MTVEASRACSPGSAVCHGADRREARERARGHGRVEARTISVVNLDTCPDLSGEFFPARAAQRLRR